MVEVLFAAATIAIILNPDYFLGGKWVKAVQGPTCEVSHILLEDEKSAAEVFAQCQCKTLNDFKRLARKKSLDGATAVRGGDLGDIRQGAMPEAFEAVAFDKNSPLGTALGPVETEFGYHILWIRNRDGV